MCVSLKPRMLINENSVVMPWVIKNSILLINPLPD